MARRHRLGTITTAVVLSAGLVTLPVPASASDGPRSTTVKTSNGGGAYAKATLTWTGDDSLVWRDVYLNDRCNAAGKGDGKNALLKLWIRRGQEWVVMAERLDLGGCKSAPWLQPTITWEGAEPIDGAGLQVCAGEKCDPVIHSRNNHLG